MAILTFSNNGGNGCVGGLMVPSVSLPSPNGDLAMQGEFINFPWRKPKLPCKQSRS